MGRAPRSYLNRQARKIHEWLHLIKGARVDSANRSITDWEHRQRAEFTIAAIELMESVRVDSPDRERQVEYRTGGGPYPLSKVAQ